jgi:hypothetical protein
MGTRDEGMKEDFSMWKRDLPDFSLLPGLPDGLFSNQKSKIG